MKYVLSCAVLFLATMAVAQLQGQPPYQTPPTFPDQRQSRQGQMPPDTQAPAPQTMSSKKVEGQIVKQFRDEPGLSGTNIDARVDDNSVVLSGTVDSITQRDLAIRIAQSNAGDRTVVDRIKVQHGT
jgi:osmotically-inducible protein OsmY